MNIGVIGGGSIGLLLAAYLRKSQFNVNVYTRSKQQAEYLNKAGITLYKNNQTEVFTVHAKVMDELCDLSDDIVFVTVKQFHIKAICEQIERKSSIPRTMVFMQNGMGHLSLIKKLPIETLFIGIVEHGAMRLSDTEVRHTGAGTIKIGAVQGTGVWSHLWKSLNSEEFPVVVLNDWLAIMERKLVVNSCINPLTAIFRVPNGRLVSNLYFLNLMRSVYEETVKSLNLAEQEGLWEEVLLVCKKTGKNRSSMLRDIESGNQTEIEAILGYTLRKGKEQRLDMPITKFLFESIKGLEQEEREKIE
ncbi:MAG: 2-dehydropantoate 2-reductase [Bacillaceae bacterium]|nr:2-dehydropantoate 2-reductase [Bacillaceae bacterium]